MYRSLNRRRRVFQRGGFTLTELLVVILILALLISLLLPAINGALRTARNAAVSAEINQLAQALESFKSKYGDYPPSRFLAVENGNYSQYFGSNLLLNQSLTASGSAIDPTSPGTGDITLGTLAQRSVTALRKFFPRVNTSTAISTGSTPWYDFNGNGTLDNPYVLHGHECLVFFLGGVPVPDVPGSPNTFGMSGFGKDLTNPFTNNTNNGNASYNGNRQPPLFEFNTSRLFLDPESATQIPGYYDSLGNAQPGGTTANFYVYFSAYGSNGYDPNDANILSEIDDTTQKPIGLEFTTSFPVSISATAFQPASSYAPNPYTSSSPDVNSTVNKTIVYQTAVFQKPQSYQILSAGTDGLYGVGGIYSPSSSSASTVLPPETSLLINTSDLNIRIREQDNLTNFKSGTLR
jgi:general secretion pathway protein G